MRPKFMAEPLAITFFERSLVVLRKVLWARHLETLCIAFSLPVLMTLVVFGLRIDSAVHEWANFLKHYDAAAPGARRSIELVVGLAYAISLAVVFIARRPKKGAA